MDTKVLAIAAAAIVALAAVGGAVYVLTSSNNNDSDSFEYTNRLLVYGNADNNNYLDNNDVELIEKIIKDGNWTEVKSQYPYADANKDSYLTDDDVKVVKNFLEGKSETMYYTDWNLGTSSIKYPLSGNIAGTYDSSLWFAQILGVYENMTYLCRTQAYIDDLSDKMFPGASARLIAQGSNGHFDTEKLIANNIKIALGDPFGIDATFLANVAANPACGIQPHPPPREQGDQWPELVQFGSHARCDV